MIHLDHASAAPPGLRGGVVAIGNFDGVHLGHQAVLNAAIARARAAGVPALAATFTPHPSRHFRPDTPPFALTSAQQKLEQMAALGLDGALNIPFDDRLAALSPAAFVDRWLVGHLGASHVVTGSDFSFGHRRAGTAAVLAALGAERGFGATAVPPVLDPADGEPVSSTRIRAALVEGDCTTASRLLTRPFTIRAIVEHGDKRGRTIGVPTANQLLGDYLRPRYGVYATRVRAPDGQWHNAVSNLGIRPMFEPPRELLESWILDWSGDLYGHAIDVALIAWLRPELQLDGLAALQAQVSRDAHEARRALEMAGLA